MTEKKSQYRKKILKHLYFTHVLSCAELSLKIDKSLPLTTKMLNELIDDGYVVETGFAPSTGGRRPIMYSLKKDVLYVVCVAMDQFTTRIVIMDMLNNCVSKVEKVDLPLANNAKALSILTEKIRQVIHNSGIPKEKFAGIGIGMPGFVDVKKGTNYSFIEPKGKSITEHISEHIGLPVYIDNDSSLIALAELRFGVAKGKKNAMVLNIGWGIGLGLILNGEMFRGNNGFAGEFSHIPLFFNGKLCSCGKRGCLETESSMQVVIEKAINGLSEGRLSRIHDISLEQIEEASEAIISAAREGDQFAIELLSEAGYIIGRGVAILIHLLNPEVIILSGRGSSAGKIWQAPMQQAINEHCIPKLAAQTVIVLSSLGFDAELIGAAALVMENIEKEPALKSHAPLKINQPTL
jgi:predicted NBD/HSP70 family sugar kinase